MTARRVLVCGGRTYGVGFTAEAVEDRQLLHRTLTEMHRANPFECVIEGGQRGADTLARRWAELAGVVVHTFKADWKTHGPSAGPIRNRQMLLVGRPDIVVAFPGNNGTALMIRLAREARVSVVKIGGDVE